MLIFFIKSPVYIEAFITTGSYLKTEILDKSIETLGASLFLEFLIAVLTASLNLSAAESVLFAENTKAGKTFGFGIFPFNSFSLNNNS